MSAGDDNVFARWSRLKQAVRYSETAEPEKDQLAPEVAAAEADANPVEEQLATAEPEAAEPAEPLPRVEDLTAESDLSAFLRKGVPKALKSAALRKMWSLDPAIRDYVGPSEYAWDFNQPGSMAGFGPLDAKESVVGFFSTISSGAPADLARAAATFHGPEDSVQTAAVSPDADAVIPADGRGDPVLATESVSPPNQPASPEPLAPVGAEAATEPAEPTKSGEFLPTTAPPRHGGAMPR